MICYFIFSFPPQILPIRIRMEVFIQTPTGETHSVVIQANWYLKDLKEELLETTGEDFKWASFTFEGEPVPSEKVLVSTGITGGCILEFGESGETAAIALLDSKYPTAGMELVYEASRNPTETMHDECLEALAVSGRFEKLPGFIHLLLYMKRYTIARKAFSKRDVNEPVISSGGRVFLVNYTNDYLRYAIVLDDPEAVDLVLGVGYDIQKVLKRTPIDLFAIKEKSLLTLQMLDRRIPELCGTYPRWCNRVMAAVEGGREEKINYTLSTYSGNTPLFATESLVRKVSFIVLLSCVSTHEKFASKLFYCELLTEDNHLTLFEFVDIKKCSSGNVKKVAKQHIESNHYRVAKKIMTAAGLDKCQSFFMDVLLIMSQTSVDIAEWIGLFEIELMTGKDIDDEAEKRGVDHPLIKAASQGQLSIVKWLLDLSPSCNVNVRSGGKITALIAASRQHAPVVKFLLERNADPNLKTESGNTALSAATFVMNVEICSLLSSVDAK